MSPEVVEDSESITEPTRDQILEMRRQVETIFHAVASELDELTVGDGGRTLRSRHRVNAMVLHLSPVETRHEKVIRSLVGMISVQNAKIQELGQAIGSILNQSHTGESFADALSEPQDNLSAPKIPVDPEKP